ncbi:carboxymethylenebutenolidase homolog [Vitis riparia]|uniref:carboxymethylenebutenolidase homolog n=1 Tax=Vitis riparia TaxID=96939 RepID=UPI00155A5E89|nr:carboxymethylenebutenolidase homolog [Vitis riparia]
MGLAMTTNTLPPALLSASSISSSFRRPLYCHYSSISASPRILSSRICKSLPSLTKNTACRVSSGQVKVEDSVDDEACELVNGVELSIGEGDDSINAYLLKAVKNNNGTGILLLSDVFGFEDSSTRDFAYRVACNGYNVLVPDLFRGNPWVKDQPKIMFQQWLATQDPQRVARDIDMSVKWLVDEFIAAGVTEKLGVIGFCFGGGRVIDVLAQDQGAHFGTGVSFYGTRINPSAAANVKVPVLFISGDDDPLCPVNLLKDIEKSIGRGSRLVIFEGRGHGFAHRPESPEDDEDAEQAFTVLRSWLQEGLAVNN